LKLLAVLLHKWPAEKIMTQKNDKALVLAERAHSFLDLHHASVLPIQESSMQSAQS
jgi:hypothetical protein